MPKRKVQKASPVTMAAIEEALANGNELTWDEKAKFDEFRTKAHIWQGPRNVLNIPRRGKRVFRVAGKVGADLDDHPVTVKLQKLERDQLAEASKRNRKPPVQAAVQVRKQRAAASDRVILKELDARKHLGRGAATVVAIKLGVSAAHVRRVRQRAKRI